MHTLKPHPGSKRYQRRRRHLSDAGRVLCGLSGRAVDPERWDVIKLDESPSQRIGYCVRCVQAFQHPPVKPPAQREKERARLLAVKAQWAASAQERES